MRVKVPLQLFIVRSGREPGRTWGNATRRGSLGRLWASVSSLSPGVMLDLSRGNFLGPESYREG